jgi:hypothetical protein
MTGQVMRVMMSCDRCGERFNGTLQLVDGDYVSTGFVITRYHPSLIKRPIEQYVCAGCIYDQTKTAGIHLGSGVVAKAPVSVPASKTGAKT